MGSPGPKNQKLGSEWFWPSLWLELSFVSKLEENILGYNQYMNMCWSGSNGCGILHQMVEFERLLSLSTTSAWIRIEKNEKIKIKIKY
jgi:hypothetical protein